jgi:hypothetical protein
LKDLERQVEVHQKLSTNVKDPAAVDIARKNVDVLQRRLVTIGEIQAFLGRARGQMNLIENSVRLLRDQVLTMASPEALGDQLSDLLTGVEAEQAPGTDCTAEPRWGVRTVAGCLSSRELIRRGRSARAQSSNSKTSAA